MASETQIVAVAPKKATGSGRPAFLFYSHESCCQTNLALPFVHPRALRGLRFWCCSRYSSLAFIVIFAFSTFDTGQPFSAASAYF